MTLNPYELAPEREMPPLHFQARKDHLVREMQRAGSQRHTRGVSFRPLARAPRRYLVVAGAILAAGAIAVPAFGVINVLRDFFEGAPPTPTVQEHFARWNEAASKIAEASARSSLARLPMVDVTRIHGVLAVTTPDRHLYLWSAPAKDGKECWYIQIANVENVTLSIYGPSGCDAVNPDPSYMWWTEFPNDYLPSLRIVFGRISGDATSAELMLADGAKLELPVVEHYFLAVIDASAITSDVTAYGADGEQIAESNRGDVAPRTLPQTSSG
jgi:hypothetical protein